MSQSLLSVGVFLAVIVCLPFAVKWLKARTTGDLRQIGGQSRLISALAVGTHQRIVTIEVGPPGGRVWLTVGVTAQSITCLHTGPAELVVSNEPVATGAAD